MRWTPEELNRRWEAAKPKTRFSQLVSQVCVRPDVGLRAFPESVHLTRTRGALGDRWERRTWMYLPDGSPDPRVQVAVTSAGVLSFLQQLTGVSYHPGDTLIVDADLTAEHLPVGSRVQAGDAVIEVSDVENDACAKFAAHYGQDVFAWIRQPANRALRLRGLFARVIEEGTVRAGDPFRRL